MKAAESLAGAVSALLPFNLLLRASGVPLMLPYHHTVSDERLPHIAPLYRYKNTRQFENDLDWLLRRFQPLHPDDLANAVLCGEQVPRGRFLLSFDDGFRELHDVAAPVLLRKGIPALFFINPAFIDNKELFYRCLLALVLNEAAQKPSVFHALRAYMGAPNDSYETVRRRVLAIHYPERHMAEALAKRAGIDSERFLREQQPFLTRTQLESLAGQGFRFGGHSMDHPSYTYLSPEEQHWQTVESVAYAQALNPSGHRFFAFPHLDRPVPQAFFDRMKEEAPILFFGLQNGRSEENNGVWHRLNAEDPQHPLPGRVRTALLYNALLRLAGRQSVKRK